jgi:hypothetical protein
MDQRQERQPVLERQERRASPVQQTDLQPGREREPALGREPAQVPEQELPAPQTDRRPVQPAWD